MNQEERRLKLIQALMAERTDMEDIQIPQDVVEQETFLRTLMNLREPGLPAEEVLENQNAYLKELLFDRGVMEFADLPEMKPHVRLWQGDITLLECDAIVDPANPDLLGCWTPGHSCIDNAVHTFAGVQLRNFCNQLTQQDNVPVGEARITPGFNLPAAHVIHTVAPYSTRIFDDRVKRELAKCYTSCYKLAKAEGCKTIAFPTLASSRSTRDNQAIARVAIRTIRSLQHESNPVNVAFVMFPQTEYQIYQSMLS